MLSLHDSRSSIAVSDQFDASGANERYLTFNTLGKIFLVKQSLFKKNPNLFYGTLFAEADQLEQFYDSDRQQYIIDISPLLFESILQYYSTEELHEPTNIQLEYFIEVFEKFHINTSSLEFDERYERYVSRQPAFQLLHVLLEYADACRLSQGLHYVCSMIALLSCSIVSLSLTARDPTIDLHAWNTTDKVLPPRTKSLIAHFHRRSSGVFILDTLCLAWTIAETVLRTLSAPSLLDYFTSLGFFDITGVLFHFIYLYMVGTGSKPSRCRKTPMNNLETFSCLTFNRRLMLLNLLRKVRLVRYIRPLKHFILSLIASKKEVVRLTVLLLFLVVCLAPVIFVLESSHIYECSSKTNLPVTRCIRTITDACYYLILIISTVGYGDVYPMSPLARFVSMFASPLSIMMLSIPLSSIYNKYTSIGEIYQMQLAMPEQVRYLVHDTTGTVGQHSRVQRKAITDVTDRIRRSLKRLDRLPPGEED